MPDLKVQLERLRTRLTQSTDSAERAELVSQIAALETQLPVAGDYAEGSIDKRQSTVIGRDQLNLSGDFSNSQVTINQEYISETTHPSPPQMASPPPNDFVARPQEFEELIALILGDHNTGTVAMTAALRGAGGYGKTTLARAICYEPRIKQAFPSGILWVTLIEHPGDLTSRVADLIEVLSGERPGFAGIVAATARLVEVMADRRLLLVIDDVWNREHLRPFCQGGPNCVRLITTRNWATLPPTAAAVNVDAMQPN